MVHLFFNDALNLKKFIHQIIKNKNQRLITIEKPIQYFSKKSPF